MFSVFRAINSFANRWEALDAFAIFCARFLPYLIMIALGVSAFLMDRISVFLFPLLSALTSRFVFTEAVHLFYQKERPAALKDTKVLIPVPKTPSFPSGHASFFFGLSFMLFSRSFELAIIFLICTILVTMARVFTGVHWFKDVLGGIATGIISAVLLNYYFIPWVLAKLAF